MNYRQVFSEQEGVLGPPLFPQVSYLHSVSPVRWCRTVPDGRRVLCEMRTASLFRGLKLTGCRLNPFSHTISFFSFFFNGGMTYIEFSNNSKYLKMSLCGTHSHLSTVHRSYLCSLLITVPPMCNPMLSVWPLGAPDREIRTCRERFLQ
jgi:hypothetical protein